MSDIYVESNTQEQFQNIELNYPSIKSDSAEESTDLDLGEENNENNLEVESILTKVTSLARKQYLSYVQKLLKINYETWCIHEKGSKQTPSDIWINKCAQKYEEKAVKSCMIIQLYRKAMLKIIAEIRHETSHSKLVRKLQKQIINDENKKNVINVETQTDEKYLVENNNVESESNSTGLREMRHKCLSLQEKIKYFQEKVDERERKIKEFKKNEEQYKLKLKNKTNDHSLNLLYRNALSSNHHNQKQYLNCSHHHSYDNQIKPRKRHISHNESQIKSVPEENLSSVAIKTRKIEVNSSNTIQNEDEIAKQLESLLGEEKNLEEEIFGDDSYNPQIDEILKEIEKAELPKQENVEILPKFTNNNNNDNINNEISQQSNISINANKKDTKNNNNNNDNDNKKTDLRDSLWPCELHMRKQKLRYIISELSEKDIRYYEIIKDRFIEIFGEDSEDEFAPYSPTIDNDEILIESCKKRIAPWIVKYLMIPMNDGLIGNRFLFKKLAKRLAKSIITVNQYPNECDVKETVEEFFCHRREINSIADMEEVFFI